MLKQACFRIQKDISHEEIDGEVVVIHFTTGNYYSLKGAAAAVWGAMKEPNSVEGLRGLFAGEGGGQALENFLEELVGEGLLEKCEGTPGTLMNGGRWQEVPVLEKYTDMQNLLLADPIHDVGEEGWPVLQVPPATGH